MRQEPSYADRHRAVAARFSALVEGVQDWDVPTPVKEWAARDVVRHLVDWLPGFLGAGSDVVLEPGPGVDDDPRAAWTHHRDQVQALLDDSARARQTYSARHVRDMPVGEVVDQFYTADLFLHAWDLARATGQDDTLELAVAEQMYQGMRAMEQVIRSSGQFGEEQPVRDGATVQERLLALIGRDPCWQPPGRR